MKLFFTIVLTTILASNSFSQTTFTITNDNSFILVFDFEYVNNMEYHYIFQLPNNDPIEFDFIIDLYDNNDGIEFYSSQNDFLTGGTPIYSSYGYDEDIITLNNDNGTLFMRFVSDGSGCGTGYPFAVDIIYGSIAPIPPVYDERYEFTYDASGNRIKREFKVVQVKSAHMASAKDFEPVEEPWNGRDITIFPNPTEGNLKIKLTGDDPQAEYNFAVYNGNGAQLLNGKLYGDGDHPIAMESYTPGIYYLVISHNGEQKSFKIIKQ